MYKLTPSEQFLIDWFNQSPHSCPVPSNAVWNEKDPILIMVSFDLREMAKAIDQLLKDKGAIY